jgi:chaperonin cofactor prefoldin
MAMAEGPAPSVVVELVLGEARLQVPLESPSSFEALVAKVEDKFGLPPDSFGIFDDFGKVTNTTALVRAIGTSTDAPCIFQVREKPVWRKLREMEEKIETLVARCPVADNIMKTIEERSSNRFTKLRSALQDLDAKVNRSIAPLLQSMALQQMDAKEAKHEGSHASPPFEEMDAKVGSIAALLQSMALQQIDLKTKLDSLSENSATHVASGGIAKMPELREEAILAVLGRQEEKAVEIEKQATNLQKEVHAQGRDVQDVHEKLQALQTEIRNLAPAPPADGDCRISPMSAMLQDLGKSPKNCNNIVGVDSRDGESHYPWADGPSNDLFANAYSGKKLHLGTSFKVGGTAAVPFARFHATRQHDRIHGSRSLPLLPPVR